MATWQLQEAKQKLSDVVGPCACAKGRRPSPATESRRRWCCSVEEFHTLDVKRSRNRFGRSCSRASAAIRASTDFADLLPHRDTWNTRPAIDFDDP